MAEGLRIRVLGTLPNGEVWSVNPTFALTAPVNTLDNDTLQEWADGVLALEGGDVFGSETRITMSSLCAITAIRAEYFGPDGDLVIAAEAAPDAPITGNGAATKPFQIALVCSLLTARVGRSYRGRLYLPALGAQFASGTVRVDPQSAGAVASEMADFLDGVVAAWPGASPIASAIVSQTRDVITRVTSVRVGDVLDTQRRRRDALAEVYQSSPLTTP